MRTKVLIVDDDPMSLERLGAALEARGHLVMTRTEALGTSTLILRERPHVVVLDVDMPALNGNRIVSMIASKVPETAFILCSGMERGELLRVASECGAAAVPKGDLGALVRTVEEALA